MAQRSARMDLASELFQHRSQVILPLLAAFKLLPGFKAFVVLSLGLGFQGFQVQGSSFKVTGL